MIAGSLLVGLLAIVAPPTDETGFVPLFDGRTTAGWTSIGGKPGDWAVRDGLLINRGKGKGWLSFNRSFANFHLRLEYRTTPGGNSGVLLRAPHQGDPSFDGLEIQILDDDAPVYRSLKPEQYTGSIYGVVASKRGHVRPPGEWNTMEIRAEGSKVSVVLNGTKVVDDDLRTHPQALTRHPGLRRSSGFVGLQAHESPVEFRNIGIKELP